MTPSLTKDTFTLYHIVDGKKVDGPHKNLWGDVSGLRGDVSGLSGYVSGLRGDVTGLRGDVNECGLTNADRAAGVDVATLIKAPEPVKQKVTLELTDEQLAQVRKLLGT
jgi:hypothetical protein